MVYVGNLQPAARELPELPEDDDGEDAPEEHGDVGEEPEPEPVTQDDEGAADPFRYKEKHIAYVSASAGAEFMAGDAHVHALTMTSRKILSSHYLLTRARTAQSRLRGVGRGGEFVYAEDAYLTFYPFRRKGRMHTSPVNKINRQTIKERNFHRKCTLHPTHPLWPK